MRGRAMERVKYILLMAGRVANEALSFVVFSFLDVLDLVLCHVYRLADFFIEAEWKPCYCSSAKEAITCSGNILVSEHGGESNKIVCMTSSNTKLELEEISDTLYTRAPLVSDVSKELRRLNRTTAHSCDKTTAYRKGTTHVRSSFTVNSTIVEMLQSKVGGQPSQPITRWSDCDCCFCNSWTSSCKDTLFVRSEEPKDNTAREDVLFIHGFISSSAFWTETLFPNFSNVTKSTYRLFAIDLLGFGRSPKPTDSLYTIREHLDMIEQSVLELNKVKSFHIVAHSLGCILALALAVKHPGAVKSLTLLAPPYYPAPKGEQATQYVMRRIAPRRVWPLIGFGASLACWYEHISRTICLLICKNHRIWEFIAKVVTRNRMRTFLLEGFFCHTHNAAWHTLHNIICGAAGKMDGYLDAVSDRLSCAVNIFHGVDDELIPVECSYNVQKKIPRATVKVFDKKDHITIVVGRQKAFARELEEIWKNAGN